jgi:hypothetical protein
MYAWSDMSKVKKDLWNKLHAFKSSVKDGVTNLAQIMIQHAQKMQKKAMGEKPLILSQVSSTIDEQ